MKNFEELENFVKNNPDWDKQLKKYTKTIVQTDYNPDWVVVMYNLFELPEDEKLFKIITQLRGTVLNRKTGEIIAAPFTKFWNYGEKYADTNFDWSKTLFTLKRDGWLCKGTKHNGKFYVFTNGSYLSKNFRNINIGSGKYLGDIILSCLGGNDFDEQGYVVWENEPQWLKDMSDGDTIMWEFESPYNVVHTHLVSEPTLWLIGYRKANGDEVNVFENNNTPFKTPRIYNFKDDKDMIEKLDKWSINVEGEGIVALYVDDSNQFHRVKVKCKDYLKVKYAENFRDRVLIDIVAGLLLKGEFDDYYANCPDNVKERVDTLREEVISTVNKLRKTVDLIKNKFSKEFAERNLVDKKSQVLYLKERYGDKSIQLAFGNYLRIVSSKVMEILKEKIDFAEEVLKK